MEEVRSTLITLIITIIALLLQIVGLVTPGWLYLSAEKLTLQFGLWYVILCVDSKCVTSITEAGNPGESIPHSTYLASMSAYQGLTTVGVIACLVAVIFLCISLRTSEQLQHGRKIILVFLLASGILAMAASARFGGGMLTAINTYKMLNQQHPYGFPYSLVLTGIGGVLAAAMFVKMACTSCSSRQNETSAANQGEMVMNPSPYIVGKA